MSTAVKHFLRHYGEMVAAMFLGMAVLGLPADWVMDRLDADSDQFMFLGRATTMPVPMVGWMMYRGHGRRANAEMAASMFVPTFAVIGVLTAGVAAGPRGGGDARHGGGDDRRARRDAGGHGRRDAAAP